MLRHRRLAAALAIAALAAAAPMTTASAAAPATARPASPPQVLTLFALGGPAVPSGHTLSDTLQGTLTLLDFSSGLGLQCTTSSWQGQVAVNPTNPSPAVITLLPSLFTISGCTDSTPGVTAVTSVTVTGLPDTLMIFGSTYLAQIQAPGGPLIITATLVTGSTSTVCTYQAIPGTNGTIAPGSGPMTFSNQAFHQVTPPAVCGTTTTQVALFSATYSPLIDNSAGGANVYVN